MADPFVAEIRMFGCNFPPSGWATCDGQLLPISQNTALFSLLGTNYGGNGSSTFGLPNLQGSAAMHWGNGAGLSQRVIGEKSGEPTVTLLSTEMPLHTHAPM
jgi:microcystin-dependent protein